MAKNTGRGTRAGAVSGRSQVQNPKTGMWVKRDSTNGQFVQAKTSGGSFKGVPKEK
jgi:hypothetical protein